MNRLTALTMIRDGFAALVEMETAAEPPAASLPPVIEEPAPDPVILVADKAQLWAATQAAKGGEVFRLAPGVWSGVLIRDVRGVTIVGQPGAVLTDINIQGGGDLTLQDIECAVAPGGSGDPLKVSKVEGLTLRGLDIHGAGDDPLGWASAMTIRNCQGVVVENCRWDRLANAVQYLDNVGVRFSRNRFTNIRMDGIRGGGNSHVLIEANRFADFRPMTGRPGIGDDHGDAIQIWTSNTTASAEEIVVRDNIVVQGEGGRVQGIFVTMQTSHRYKAVEVTDNLVIGGLTNAITVAGADGVLIARNTVAAVKDKTWIRMSDLTGLTLTDNKANDYTKLGTVQVALESGNTKLPVVSDGGAGLLAARAA